LSVPQNILANGKQIDQGNINQFITKCRAIEKERISKVELLAASVADCVKIQG
jgi:hypothetical protein